MDTMYFELPDSLKDFVQIQISEGGYKSVSEYIGELIRTDRQNKAHAILEAEVLKGIRSGPSMPVTKQDWNEIRDEVRDRIESRISGLKSRGDTI